MKKSELTSWMNIVKKLLRKYYLPSAYDLVHVPPWKILWKMAIKIAVQEAWTEKIQEAAGKTYYIYDIL